MNILSIMCEKSIMKAKLFQSLCSFEVDMSFKRRIMEKAVPTIFYFKKVFEIIHDLSGYLVQFFYLHRTGIETIIVDMDEGQRDVRFGKMPTRA
ncbi:uncharacterized protein ANIA_11355 [Aspergillus nidulans FGSC A4]|uniref:Uncharacterized protein n=1 Tax=Emericella nidulans (strain FGSC A4 / ATCC 38163 / CBS 112.46 / NRRL 194 / M139) TaxID=227321 RepID=C8VHI0_EMENI|nr:hypothetical protein [Aspergillus nidulans FGSC A4]CBF84333.1 TPA: hypothetical protein ANIA_11355 [Aspergillus nidulans FGSC A4]